VGRFKDLAIDELNATRSRRGKNARNRGNSFEREVASKLGGIRVGQYGGKTDVEVPSWLAIQCKVGTAYPERIDGWLRSISVKGDQLQAVVLGESPGIGGRRRTIIVLDVDAFAAYYGKSADEDSYEGD
jgi:hypothetical protein